MQLNRKITGNIIALGVLQLGNYVFPFLTVPYLSHLLSVEHYGIILLATSFSAYFGVICDYGFLLSATREVALNSHNPEKLKRIVSNVMTIKLGLFICSFLACLLIVLLLPSLRSHWLIYLTSFFSIVTNVFFPVWFFQGIEKMRYIAVVNLVIRTLAVMMILLLIKSDAGYYWVPIFNSLAAIIGAIFAQWLMLTQFKISYVRPLWREMKQQLSSGWHIFVSTVAVSVYLISNSFFLGLFLGAGIVAFYALADKLIAVVNSLLNPLFQALFPHVAKIVHADKVAGIVLLRATLLKVAFLGGVLSLLLFSLAPWIVPRLFGVNYLPTIPILKIMAILPFIIGLSNVVAVQTMIPFGLEHIFSKIYIIAAVFHVLVFGVMTYTHGLIGAATSIVLTESLVVVMMIYSLYHNGIYLFHAKLRLG